MTDEETGDAPTMPPIHIEMLGQFLFCVDGVSVADSNWARRHAAALVKVLCLTPGRRLHREQVIDLLWPDDTIVEALPKLHKAAHYARRAIDVPNSLVLRDEHVFLLPDAEPAIDVLQFEDLGRRALSTANVSLAREALALYGGELLPHDRYEGWADERREQLRLRQLELLRLDERWEAVIELDAEAGLGLDALAILDDEAHRFVVGGLVPAVPRDAGPTLDIERDQRVRADDPRAEPQEVEAADHGEPVTVTEALARRTFDLKRQVRVLGLERQPTPAMTRCSSEPEREHVLPLAIDEADRSAKSCRTAGGLVRRHRIFDVLVGARDSGAFCPCDSRSCER